MAQQGKGSLIRVLVLVGVLVVAAGGFYFVQQQRSKLNTVEKIELYVNSGKLLNMSLEEAKVALGHDSPTPKAGEENVFHFDMRQKDPSLTVLVEVVVRGGVIAAHRTYDADGAQTGG